MAEALGLSPEQLEERGQGLGSSDAAPAVGMSKWKSPVELWLEKTGRVPREDLSKDPKKAELLRFGNRMEQIVADEISIIVIVGSVRLSERELRPRDEADLVRRQIDRSGRAVRFEPNRSVGLCHDIVG